MQLTNLAVYSICNVTNVAINLAQHLHVHVNGCIHVALIVEVLAYRAPQRSTCTYHQFLPPVVVNYMYILLQNMYAIQVPPLVFQAGAVSAGSLVLFGGLTERGAKGGSLFPSNQTVLVLLHGQAALSGEYPAVVFDGQSAFCVFSAYPAFFICSITTE